VAAPAASITAIPAQLETFALAWISASASAGDPAQLHTGLHQAASFPSNRLEFGLLHFPDPGHLRQGITLIKDSKAKCCSNLWESARGLALALGRGSVPTESPAGSDQAASATTLAMAPKQRLDLHLVALRAWSPVASRLSS